MSRVNGSRNVAILAGVVAAAAVALVVALVLAITGVIPTGGSPRPPATYADGSDTPQTDKEGGCPTNGTSLAGSRLTINDPSGKAIVDTAIDCNPIQQKLGEDQKYHITPGILPGFWYLRDHYELPQPGHQGDRWVPVGHTGPPEANAPLTGMVEVPQRASYQGYTATFVTPLGTEQLGLQLAVNIGNSDITDYLGKQQKTPGERYVVGCRVVNGQVVDQTVVLKFVPIESL